MAADGMELVFLGTGTSHGVPMIGCDCAVCRSDDPRDRRNRCSAALRLPDGGVILIDTPPELRLAALACGLDRVDAILFTHAHADHIMGLDDVRRFNDLSRRAIPCYGSEPTLRRLREVFGYAEIAYDSAPAYRPAVSFRLMESPMRVCGREVCPVPLLHGSEPVLGFRIAGLAYCTDCSVIPARSRRLLQGLEVLVLDALRHTPHPTHLDLKAALDVVADLRPRRALLTHITHHLPHRATAASLPENVAMAHDGMSVRFGNL